MTKAESGSEVSVDRALRVIRFAAWGFWSEADLAEFQEQFRQAVAGMGGGTFSVLADLRRYATQRPEVSNGMQDIMKFAARSGMVKAANWVHGAMTEMQIRRLAKEVSMINFCFFRTEHEALTWLQEPTTKRQEK